MTKELFLKELERKLKYLPADERTDAVEFYREYFEDAGPENEQKVLEELKSPSHIASKILAEFAEKEMSAGDNAKSKRKRNVSNVVVFTVLALFAAPIALPFLLALVIIMVVLFITLGACLFAFFMMSFGFFIGALWMLFWKPDVAFLLLGFALIATGISIMLILFIKFLFSFIIKNLARR